MQHLRKREVVNVQRLASDLFAAFFSGNGFTQGAHEVWAIVSSRLWSSAFGLRSWPFGLLPLVFHVPLVRKDKRLRPKAKGQGRLSGLRYNQWIRFQFSPVKH